MMWGDYGSMGLMGVGWLLVFAALVALAWFAMRFGRAGSSRHESPEQTLKQRYASGEIDRPTYERMLANLRR